MRFQYLGTAAAEGWPAVFCNCPYCKKAWKLGGKNIRTRAQALINDDLLIDLGPDTYLHKLRFGLNLDRVKYLLITHMHMDHFYPQELTVRGSCYSYDMASPDLEIYCAQETRDFFDKCTNGELEKESARALHWHILKAFTPVQAGPYTVMPLPACHMGEKNEPFMFQITSREGKTVYYLHDSGYYKDSVWDYLSRQKQPASLISLDATCGEEDTNRGSHHMGIPEALRVMDKLKGFPLIGPQTHVVLNHFSHNGHLLYHEAEALAAPHGAEVSWDGRIYTL